MRHNCNTATWLPETLEFDSGRDDVQQCLLENVHKRDSSKSVLMYPPLFRPLACFPCPRFVCVALDLVKNFGVLSWLDFFFFSLMDPTPPHHDLWFWKPR